MQIRDRLPTRQQILGVYGMISLIVYGWTLVWFFWKLPSWIFFLNLGEIATVFAYSAVTNFIESLLVISGPILLSLVLPKNWFLDHFVPLSSSFVLASLGYVMYVALQIGGLQDYPDTLVDHFIPAAVLILLFSFLVVKTAILRRLFEIIVDRAIIFSYIFLPISVISLIVVIARNIF